VKNAVNKQFYTRACSKLEEAEFFLDKMAHCENNLLEIRFYFSAFVSAARSVTFSLQSTMDSLQGFRDWYEIKQDELRLNPIAKFFVERRNDALKKGENENIQLGIAFDNKGHLVIQSRFYSSSNRPVIREKSPQCIEGLPVVEACHEYIEILRRLMSECHTQFVDKIDPLSVEDFEEWYGFPRGWTDLE
jgi:hypothetical protein